MMREWGMRFQPTYKGLKQMPVGLTYRKLIGFQPTYKGLKCT